MRKSLTTQGGRVHPVAKDDLSEVLARNLKYFMKLPGCPYPTANALAVAAGISPNTVRYYMDPRKRPPTTDKAQGFPTLDKLEILAGRLGRDTWELLHPDIERSVRERDFYKQIESDFKVRATGTSDLDRTFPVVQSNKRVPAKVR